MISTRAFRFTCLVVFIVLKNMTICQIGPGIPKNETRSQIVLNIDLMPTLLELTGMKKWAKLGSLMLSFCNFEHKYPNLRVMKNDWTGPHFFPLLRASNHHGASTFWLSAAKCQTKSLIRNRTSKTIWRNCASDPKWQTQTTKSVQPKRGEQLYACIKVSLT